MWNAKVKIAGTLVVGDSKYGTRRMIPITGGSFEGPKIKGVVLPGGEDWQLARPDGDTEMEARYLLKTDDGTVIRVTNRALMHFPSKGEKAEPYIKSVLEMEVPNNSPYAFLNHAKGMKVYGATILPFGKSFYDKDFRQTARDTVNAWIRTSGSFDAVIDFEKVMVDPNEPKALLPTLHSGDFLHPNEAGYAKMGEFIDLKLFE